MKILIILLALALFSCNNSSDQKQTYRDSAQMFLDSMVKYKAVQWTPNDTLSEIRKARFDLYKIMYDYYKERAK